jgi:hypothetical protein
MLFDLRATGRRRVVKIIYAFLAILMGGGLVLFGVGGSGFGLLNSDQNSGSGGSGVTYEDQAAKAEKSALKPGPKATESAIAAKWANATKARFQAASSGFDTQSGAYTAQAQEQLKLAAEDWQQYLKVNRGDPDLLLAKLMAQAYGQGALNQPTDAVRAWQVVVAAESTAPNYSMLALNAYLASDSKIAESAAQRALAMTPKAQRANLKAQFRAAQAQAKAQQRAAAEQAAQQSGGVGGLP